MTTYLSSDNIITSIGSDTSEVLTNIELGKTGIKQGHTFSKLTKAPISSIDHKSIQSELAGIYPGINFTRFEGITVLSLHKALSKSKFDIRSTRTLFILSSTKGNIELLNGNTPPSEDIFLYHSAQKIADIFGFVNTPLVICNACISGVLALIVAKRCIDGGKFDNVVVTGADVVSKFVVAGFESFKSMSEKPCRPFDAHRDGLSLGEGSATLIITRYPENNHIKLISGASANDANHISGPSPTGEGLYLAALNSIRSISDIDFISAHGTATPYNDDMESAAIHRLGLDDVPVNSFKGYFGHTLGAAGVVEVILTKHSMLNGIIYKTLGLENQGVVSPLFIPANNIKKELKHCLKLSSGFGGCNAAILLERDEK
jgi:3-oxoacyl-[acyl-carrier-protein] synthase-1